MQNKEKILNSSYAKLPLNPLTGGRERRGLSTSWQSAPSTWMPASALKPCAALPSPRFSALKHKSLREHHLLPCFLPACEESPAFPPLRGRQPAPSLLHGQGGSPASPTRLWRTWGTNSHSRVRAPLVWRHDDAVKRALKSAFRACYCPAHQFKKPKKTQPNH